MYPTNQYMDPYYSPYRSHTPYPYPYYPPPGWEAAGHPGAMDPPYRPPSYGPWPYSAGMHGPHPPEFHCCCNQSYPAPAGYYGFRPPFPQELPPPAHLYYHGPNPHHPNEYPSYFARPLPYPVEQTPYDYDQNKFKNHCCGCSNHVCHGGEKSNVKVEEEKPERQLKDADSSSIIRHPNNQYPVIWLPWGNTEDKENGKRYELLPQLLNGWVPVAGKRTEDAKEQWRDDQKEKKQYQWPLVWMPAGYDEPKQKDKEFKEEGDNPKIPEETPPSPKIKIIPLSWFEDQKLAAKSGSQDYNDRSTVESQPTTTADYRDGAAMEGHHRTTPVVPRRVNYERKPARENYKTIPVLPEKETDQKKLGTCRNIPVTTQKENDEKKPALVEKKDEKQATNADDEKQATNADEKKSGTYRDIPVMMQKENDEKKAAVSEKKGENGKGNHSESPKHSKLPPVCLRVDPLPRKKSGNGSSRSPSPPRKDADKPKKNMNKTQSQNLEPKQQDTKKHATVSEMTEKSPEELKKVTGFSNETFIDDSEKNSPEEEVPTSNDHRKVQASSTNDQAQENAAGAETLKGGDKSTDRDSETFRANLSEVDAARRIQAAYRGYDVRRWQPLDKLRKIRDVHEQMQGVRKQLQSLEASSKKPTEKEHVAIGEAVMNLLLKLDTIQGLHPCVREARKSLARELICLQEKLDSLCKQPSGGFNDTIQDEKLDTAPTLTAEASAKEVKAVGLSEANETSPVKSMELDDAVPSEVNMEVGQGIDPSGLKNQNENSCTNTMEVPREEGKSAAQVEFEGVSSTDMMSVSAFPEHTHVNNERQMEETNTGSLEVIEEEKKAAAANEMQDTPPMDSMGPLNDAAPTVDSSGQKKCMASTGQSLHAEESIADVSPAVAGDNRATTARESSDNGLAADNDFSAQNQPTEAVGVARPELRHDVSPAEETPDVTSKDPLVCLNDTEPREHDPATAADSVTSNVDEQPEEARNVNMQEQVADTTPYSTKEPDGISEVSMGPNPDVTLEDPQVSLKDAEPHEHDPTTAAHSVTSNIDEQPEEARNMNMQEQVAGAMLDSTEESDVTSEASMGPTSEECAQAALLEPTPDSVSEQTFLEELNNARQSELSASMGPTSEECAQAALLEPTSDSISEQTVLEELNNARQSALSGKDDEQHVDEKNEVHKLRGEEFDVQENHRVAEGADSRTETVFQELDSSGSSAGYERPELTVSLESQIAEAKSNEGVHSSCPDAQTSKEAPTGIMGANSVEEADVEVPQAEGDNGTDNSTICTTGANSAEVEPDNPKEGVSVQTENNESSEALSAVVTSDSVKDSDEKKLAEENQKLKELLQKLLASGNDQTELITGLSEKVKMLERKLARKKKPKVRVHRPARHTTAKVH